MLFELSDINTNIEVVRTSEVGATLWCIVVLYDDRDFKSNLRNSYATSSSDSKKKRKQRDEMFWFDDFL